MNNPTEPIPTEPARTEPIPTEPAKTRHTSGLPYVEASTTPEPDANEPTRHPVRIGTLVWGVIVVAIGVLVILTRQAGLGLAPGQIAMWLLFGAGVAMVAGGAINLAVRK